MDLLSVLLYHTESSADLHQAEDIGVHSIPVDASGWEYGSWPRARSTLRSRVYSGHQLRSVVNGKTSLPGLWFRRPKWGHYRFDVDSALMWLLLQSMRRENHCMLQVLFISLGSDCERRSLPEDSQLLSTLNSASTWISSQISLLLFDSIRYPLNKVSYRLSWVTFENL